MMYKKVYNTLVIGIVLSSLLNAQNSVQPMPTTYDILTATRSRSIALSLLACYALYNGYSWYSHRAIQLQAAQQPIQPIEHHNHTQWIFVPGLADNYKQAEKYTQRKNAHGFLPENSLICNFQDACENLRETYHNSHQIPWNDLLTVRQSSLAQNKDMEVLHELMQQNTDKNLILFGVSRGASTIINYVGMHKPGNVKALILESPYDDVHSIVKGMFKKVYLHWLPPLTTVGNLTCACLFKHYTTCAIAPIDVVSQIPHHIPVIIICSEKDSLVPASSSERLYEALLTCNHPQVTFLKTTHGAHGQIISSESGNEFALAIDQLLANAHSR